MFRKSLYIMDSIIVLKIQATEFVVQLNMLFCIANSFLDVRSVSTISDIVNYFRFQMAHDVYKKIYIEEILLFCTVKKMVADRIFIIQSIFVHLLRHH